VTGRFAAPVSADTFMLPPAPTFAVATEKAALPFTCGMLTNKEKPLGKFELAEGLSLALKLRRPVLYDKWS